MSHAEDGILAKILCFIPTNTQFMLWLIATAVVIDETI